MSDVVWLLLVFVAVGLFVLYEMFGVDPRFKHVHSISWYARRHRWLAIAIAALFVLGGIGGVVWWVHHLQYAPIYK